MTPKITKLQDYDNSWFDPGASFVKRYLWIVTSFFIFQNPLVISRKLKKWVLILFGAEVGRGFYINKSAKIKYPWNLVVGDNVWVGEECWIDNLVMTRIGSNVCLSQGSMLLTGNHNYKLSTFDLIVKEIVLEDGVWIGAKSIVTGGVVCKSHSVLGVNSVASQDLEPYMIYSGNPCKFIRKREIS